MRVVCLSCIDGRIHDAVFRGVRSLYQDAIVDLITEPGMDGFLEKSQDIQKALLMKVDLSFRINGAHSLICVGHYDCKGNPVSSQAHLKDIKDLLLFFKKCYPQNGCRGLWINDKWCFEEVLI